MNFRYRLLDPFNVLVAVLMILFMSSVLASFVH
jgi:hypothetical protein